MFFFFNDTAATGIYTLSLHDALPISSDFRGRVDDRGVVAASEFLADLGQRRVGQLSGEVHRDLARVDDVLRALLAGQLVERSEEHTSELQSRLHLVCRLLLEKKNINL